MSDAIIPFRHDERRGRSMAFRFTPAEWRVVLEDETFLDETGNSYAPRSLMGVPVEIVPDHKFG